MVICSLYQSRAGRFIVWGVLCCSILALVGHLMRYQIPIFLLSSSYDIEWLHIPKTGTSFGNTLVRWACSGIGNTTWITKHGVDVPKSCLAKFRRESFRKEFPIGDHVSLQGRSDDDLRRVFTMIRSPWSRVLSGYHFFHSFDKNKKRHYDNVTPAQVCKFARTHNRSHVALGAQTKIISGEYMKGTRPKAHTFISADPPDLSLADEACRRLKLFAFVGISDFWEASMCFFHAIHGGKMTADELVNVRPGNYTKENSPVPCDECFDAADEILYSCAVDIFGNYSKLYPKCARFIRLPNETVSKNSSPVKRLKSLGCPLDKRSEAS